MVNIKLLAERAGVSFATAARMVEALQKLGIVREVTGRARERVFVYGGYLDLLAQVGGGMKRSAWVGRWKAAIEAKLKEVGYGG
ncbi:MULTISPECIES: hypothetical protein [unclassified Methylococcus]|uniref:hypothetical protein n=1 Tax=unclassified Methylococcus TaxID=2618889 RepID=UPI003D7E6F27